MGVLRHLLASVPEEVAGALESEFQGLELRFGRGDWGPAELNGGRFAEAVLRYLEWKRAGTYTRVGEQVDRTRIVRGVENDGQLPEGLRFLVCKGAELLLDLRNRRDVAHLGSVTGVSGMDSALVMRVASWMLAEIVREEGGASPREAEEVIEKLNARRVPLVEEIGGDIVVLAEKVDAPTRALLALYHTYPRPLGIGELLSIVRYGNSTRFRRLLEAKESEGLLHLKDRSAYLTRKGVAWLEKHVDMELRV
jgi:hypothetical protein